MEKELDLLLPPEMAQKAEELGVSKSQMSFSKTMVLAILAGVFISLGAVFSTVVTAGGGLPYGPARLLGGMVFGLGLVLVVVGGAELFTGNTLIVMAWANRRISTSRLLRNWLLVYVGNFVGAMFMVLMILLSGHFMAGKGAVGAQMLQIAKLKCELGFMQALVSGILCNVLVCLAVWLSFSARDVTGKILVILIPVSAFVAAGFEHSIANMYFIPLGIVLRNYGDADFWVQTGFTADQFSALHLNRFLVHNLLPVTLGNIIGGALLVGMVYWFVYLRDAKKNTGK